MKNTDLHENEEGLGEVRKGSEGYEGYESNPNENEENKTKREKTNY